MKLNFKEVEKLLSDVDDILTLIKVSYKAVCHKAERAKREYDIEEYGDMLTLKYDYEGLLSAISDHNLDNITERFNAIIDKEEEK